MKKVLLSLLFICVSASSVFAGIDPNLVGWWPCDCQGIDKIALDWSGHGKDGTVQGATVVAGHKGWALNFNAGGQYVDLPIGNTISTLNSTTIATWVNFANTGGAWQRIFDFGNDTTVYMFLSPRIDSLAVISPHTGCAPIACIWAAPFFERTMRLTW